jgi:ABC-type glycerol-3-phosphate transport system substrate-binding protein
MIKQASAIALLLSLVACTSAPAPSTLPAVSNDMPVTLTVWHAQTGVAETTLSSLFADFHKAYPTITVNAQTRASEGDLLRQGIAGMAMNQLPDVMIANPRTIVEFAQKDVLVSLDTVVTDPALGFGEPERADFLPGLIDAARFSSLKNQLFAFPFDEHLVVLFYNADALKTAKLAAPKTWDEFAQAARTTTRGDAHGWVMSPDAITFYAMVSSRGGNVVNDTQTQVLFGENPGIQSLQMITALAKGDAAYLAPSSARAIADFAQGKAIFFLGTDEDLAPISEAMTAAKSTFQWGMTNLPQSDTSRLYTSVFGTQIALFKSTSERQRAAWLLTRWLALPEQTARWARSTLAIPVRVSAFPLLVNQGTPNVLFQRLNDGLVPNIPTGRASPNVRDAAQIDAAVVEMWIAVANGTDPGTALNRAVTRANRILNP